MLNAIQPDQIITNATIQPMFGLKIVKSNPKPIKSPIKYKTKIKIIPFFFDILMCFN